MSSQLTSWLTVYALYFLRFFILGELLKLLLRIPGQTTVLATSGALALTAMGLANYGDADLAYLNLESINAIGFIWFAAQELFVVCMVALPLLFALACLPLGARFVDVSRGAQFAEQVQPEQGDRVSFFENAAGLLVSLAFFATGIYQLLLEPLLRMPLAALAQAAEVRSGMSKVWPEFAEDLARIVEESIAVGLEIAAPVVLMIAAVDLLAMIVTRVLGRINVLFELMPLKMLLGFVVFTVTLAAGPESIPNLVQATASSSIERLSLMKNR